MKPALGYMLQRSKLRVVLFFLALFGTIILLSGIYLGENEVVLTDWGRGIFRGGSRKEEVMKGGEVKDGGGGGGAMKKVTGSRHFRGTSVLISSLSNNELTSNIILQTVSTLPKNT